MEKQNVCRTAIGISIQAAKLLNKPYQYLKYTTLNERFNINETAQNDLTEVGSIKYYTIGDGAHRMYVTDGGRLQVIDPVSHETTDASLYNPTPFVLREINNDLTELERNRYALRRKETHDNKEYWAYYLKRLEMDNVPPQIVLDNTKNGLTTSREFHYTNENLYPKKRDLPPEGIVVSSADLIRVTSKVRIDFNEQDVAEYLNVCKVLYGSDKSAIISEIGICTGVDRKVTVDTGLNQTVEMNEAIGVQVVTFISTFNLISTSNMGFYHEYELGGDEPLLTGGESRNSRYSPDVTVSAQSKALAGTIYDASYQVGKNTPTGTKSISGTKP